MPSVKLDEVGIMVWGCCSAVAVPVKATLSDSADQDYLDNLMLTTLWEQFGNGLFLFQHDCPSLHKAKSIKTWMSEFDVEERYWLT